MVLSKTLGGTRWRGLCVHGHCLPHLCVALLSPSWTVSDLGLEFGAKCSPLQDLPWLKTRRARPLLMR